MGGAKSAPGRKSELWWARPETPSEGCDADGDSEMTDGSVSSAEGHAAAAMLQAMRDADVAAEASLRPTVEEERERMEELPFTPRERGRAESF